MRLQVRRLQIVVVAGDGRFGIDLPLGDGLTVIRADNSMGKSTIANSILYGLGGEGMLSPRWESPLKYCQEQYLVDDDGSRHDVLESYVMLELVNGDGEWLSVRRWVKSDIYKSDLVQLWDGAALSDPSSCTRKPDAFIRTAGSASREAGFHTQLANFAGWGLPQVTRYDGSSALLYLQLLFPFFIVEQLRGWVGVRANVPRFLQVRDPDRRAVEFLLALDAEERASRREALQAQIAGLRRQWEERVAEYRGVLRREPVALENLPDRPVASWPPEPAPVLRVLDGDEWISLDTALASLRDRLKDLQKREIPAVEAAAQATEERLVELEEEHRELAAGHTQLVRESEGQVVDLGRLETHLESLRADRDRHRDAQKIVSLGGSPAAELEHGNCPTCDQTWPADLLGGGLAEPVMSFAEHVDLIDQEMRALRAVRDGAQIALDEGMARERAIRQALVELRADIRAHRQTLVADGGRPSVAVLRECLLAEDRIRRLDELGLGLTGLIDELDELSAAHREAASELASLDGTDLSDSDHLKLETFQDVFLEQLREYGFRSLDGVSLSEATYLPERQGFDLTHEVSASDTIRLIWAYLLGLLETAAAHETNHPGFLLLDEPGQQDIEDESLKAFLARASRAVGVGNQVVVTVTRPMARVRSSALEGATIHDFGSREHVLQRMG
jgi:hypothetical protein